jgi:hypothetical protein
MRDTRACVVIQALTFRTRMFAAMDSSSCCSSIGSLRSS